MDLSREVEWATAYVSARKAEKMYIYVLGRCSRSVQGYLLGNLLKVKPGKSARRGRASIIMPLKYS
jgi:hypothetical protein